MSKRLWNLTLSLFLLFFVWIPITAIAQEEPLFELTKTRLGTSKVQIDVSGKHLTDVYAFQFNLDYDPAELMLIEASSPISGFTVEPILKEGDLLFAHTKVGNAPGIDGDAVLATLIFEQLHAEETSIKLYRMKMVDSELEMVDLELDIGIELLPQRSSVFTDIQGHWAEESILEAALQGWVTGYNDQTFRPNQSITRAEFTALLVRALQVPELASNQLSFTDQEQIPDWARPYIAAAVQEKWIQGYTDGTFRPDQRINRAEMATMIIRSGGLEPQANMKPTFQDTELIPLWAQPYIALGVEKGLIKGMSDHRFAPLNHATRAESVHLILSLLSAE